ncbi:Hypothetical predicted protein [Podarcis lilfordi]|uniref:Uncharacterized protein n=1 Tax=Podarcis lilfordi TaxID=74358 RepID=A0AA35W2C2_9SAUR|nr:Hypothetical predicted protein [Podarcis lilfordi]
MSGEEGPLLTLTFGLYLPRCCSVEQGLLQAAGGATSPALIGYRWFRNAPPRGAAQDRLPSRSESAVPVPAVPDTCSGRTWASSASPPFLGEVACPQRPALPFMRRAKREETPEQKRSELRLPDGGGCSRVALFGAGTPRATQDAAAEDGRHFCPGPAQVPSPMAVGQKPWEL